MRRVPFVVSVFLACLCVLTLSAAARHLTPSGSFVLNEAAPAAGQLISFTVDVINLPTNGGATISPFIELSCGTVYEELEGAIYPVIPGTENPTLAYFTLSSSAWVAAGLNAQSCEAYLFYDGWNGPRRRKTNTLAALFFTVAAQ